MVNRKMTNGTSNIPSEMNMSEKLLRSVKKEVKQIMEESVSKKSIHIESNVVTSLCAALEACLQHGLKKRSLGLFKNANTTLALLNKIAKQCNEAKLVLAALADVEKNYETLRKSGAKVSVVITKYMWLRVALSEKRLAKIIEYVVENCNKYYESGALLADPCDGPLLASLLVGPCALEVSKMKTADHYWTDPPADELMQRHRIHHGSTSSHLTTTSRPDQSPKRPGLQVSIGRRHTSSSSEEARSPFSAKDYVESLHQNSRSQLLYGKNNVVVQPKEDTPILRGYLSLHQGSDGLTIKWTPNQLMNGCTEAESQPDKRPIYAKYAALQQYRNSHQNMYWDYALTIHLDEIVYLHCHQQPDCGGTIVLVGQDGIQHPPLHFPKGGHLLAFLSCMETGLLPHSQLDPPLWSQRGKGKVFPRLPRKSRNPSGTPQSPGRNSQHSSRESVNATDDTRDEEEEATDYVFRIVSAFKPEETNGDFTENGSKEAPPSPFSWPRLREALSMGAARPNPAVSSSSTSSSSVGSGSFEVMQNYAKAQEELNSRLIYKEGNRSHVRQVCDTMKTQILSRAFYGWLSYCRHQKTLRTHVAGLVNGRIYRRDEPTQGLTPESWDELKKHDLECHSTEFYRRIYYGGCTPTLRPEVWPYLLGVYPLGSSVSERSELDDNLRLRYEQSFSEWMAVAAIVRQMDKESTAANLVKAHDSTHDSTDLGPGPLLRKDSSLSSEVFESVDSSDDFSHPETVPEETSSQLVSPLEERMSLTPSTQSSQGDSTRTRNARTSCGSLGVSGTGDEGVGSSVSTTNGSRPRRSNSIDPRLEREIDQRHQQQDTETSILVTQPSVIEGQAQGQGGPDGPDLTDMDGRQTWSCSSQGDAVSSNASQGGTYTEDFLKIIGNNLHRIEKDVDRCDRNYVFFGNLQNLDTLKNIMCTYVWDHLDVGYIQGMCDLLAPLLVLIRDEAMTYACFNELMKRLCANFPQGGAMDHHLANIRSLMQVMDPEMSEHMYNTGDFTHFYFTYRWFLLDFKREFVYDDIFTVWETIWAARHVSSSHFPLFLAMALVHYYREIILENKMEFTDTIRFFNDLAERHPTQIILQMARDLICRLQEMIENQ